MRLKDKQTNGILTVKLIQADCEGLKEHEVETLYGEPITLETLNKYCEDVPEEKKYGGRAPKVGDAFWFIMCDGSINEGHWDGVEYDKARFECGSAFWTKEEAEKELARHKAYAILKEDTKGFVPDWKNENEWKYYVVYDNGSDKLVFECREVYNGGERLYFASRVDVNASIKAHPSEWKTWLRVEG